MVKSKRYDMPFLKRQGKITERVKRLPAKA